MFQTTKQMMMHDDSIDYSSICKVRHCDKLPQLPSSQPEVACMPWLSMWKTTASQKNEAGWVSSVKGTFQRETPLTPYNLYTFDGKNKFCLRFSLKQTNAMKTQLPTSIVRKLGDTPNLMELITFFYIAITWGILHFPNPNTIKYQDSLVYTSLSNPLLM